MLIPMFCNPVWRKFIDILVLLGKIPETKYGVTWTAPKFESVDPLKDSIADLHRMRSGTLPLFEAITQQGLNPIDTLEEYALGNRELDKRGLVLDSDPRNVSFRGVEQKADSGEVVPEGTPGAGVQPGPAAKPKTNGVAKNGANKLDFTGLDPEKLAPESRDWRSPSRTYRN
jgi:hypothetical protein